MGDIRSEKFVTGNRVFLYTSGEGGRELLGEGLVGRLPNVTGVDGTIGTGAQYVRTIGTALPAGIVDTAHDFRIRLSTVKFSNQQALDTAIARPIDIVGADRFSDGKLLAAEECHLDTHSFRMNANQLVQGDMNFLAMRMKMIS